MERSLNLIQRFEQRLIARLECQPPPPSPWAPSRPSAGPLVCKTCGKQGVKHLFAKFLREYLRLGFLPSLSEMEQELKRADLTPEERVLLQKRYEDAVDSLAW